MLPSSYHRAHPRMLVRLPLVRAGRYGTAENSATCAACGAGKWSAVGSSSCVCAAGYHGTGTCSPCAIGEYQSQIGQSDCLPCPLGTFGSATASASCTPCPLRHYRSASHGSVTACELCPVGTIAPATGAMECDVCEAGTYETNNRLNCTAAPIGAFVNARCVSSRCGCILRFTTLWCLWAVCRVGCPYL